MRVFKLHFFPSMQLVKIVMKKKKIQFLSIIFTVNALNAFTLISNASGALWWSNYETLIR